MIKAVTFDLDGVYFSGESFRKFKNQLTSDPQHADWVFFSSPQNIAFRTGKMTETDFWNFVRTELSLKLSNTEIFTLLRESYEINQDVAAYIKVIKQRSLKTCLCSNNYVTRVRELDSKFHFLSDFDIRIFSYEVGTLKPDKQIFTALIKQAQALPCEIIYSDDNATKLTGAIELGINAFVYEGFTKFKQTVDELIGTA